jgi:hypothetical protein
MNVFILFLLASFIFSGTRLAAPIFRRPSFLVAMSIVVGASFYSLRVVG